MKQSLCHFVFLPDSLKRTHDTLPFFRMFHAMPFLFLTCHQSCPALLLLTCLPAFALR